MLSSKPRSPGSTPNGHDGLPLALWRLVRMLPIEWRVGARNDLVQIVGFIARENPAAARRLRELIDAATIPLAKHPYLFRRSDRVPGTREVVCIPTM